LGAASAATSLQTEDVNLADIEARLSRLKASSQRQ
jgi:hypothetical protein